MSASIRLAAMGVMIAALMGCSSTGAVKTATSLYDQMGGASSLSKLSGNFLSSAASNPQLSSLLGGVDKVAAGSKLNDQLCSALGGGCKAPLQKALGSQLSGIVGGLL